MVEYGKALKVARRQEWENAYLDYNGLKHVIEKIEGVLCSRDSERVRLLDSESLPKIPGGEKGRMDMAVAKEVNDLRTEFFLKLNVEIEKVSLFCLKKQGELADAVGAIRFDFTGLFDRRAVPIHSQSIQNDLEMYGALSAELAHVLKFICINSIGIQKILKKYNKIFERMDEPHYYFVESDHLRLLANSQSIMAIHASLKAVMDECYQRENITKPETALSLLRFQCVMECISILRRNAGLIQFPFVDFLSKKSRIVTNTDFGGMDGGGRRALQWLLKLEPQTMLNMDQSQLERMWHKWSAETKFVHSYLFGGLPYGRRRVRTYTSGDVLDAIGADNDKDLTTSKWAWGGVNKISMILNLLSILLYTINYYIVAPTANHYALSLGMDGAFGATLIGASSFSALFSAFVYSLWYTRSTFRSALIFSAVCPLLGNLIYALAISYDSMPMAIAGRILCGFGSAEVLNRQLISTCVKFDDMTQASALFVAFGASGMSIGPLLAGILDMTAGRDMRVDLKLPFTPVGGIIYNHITAPGFLMAFLWLLQLASLFIVFLEPIRVNTTEQGPSDQDKGKESGDDSEPDSSMLTRIDSEASRGTAYGSIFSSEEDDAEPYLSKRCIGPRDLWGEMVSTWNLVFQNSGLPVTLLIFSYIEMADEVIISSCSMVFRQYFEWHGSVAGFFIAGLGALVLPAHFVVEKASHHIPERKILFVSAIRGETSNPSEGKCSSVLVTNLRILVF